MADQPKVTVSEDMCIMRRQELSTAVNTLSHLIEILTESIKSTSQTLSIMDKTLALQAQWQKAHQHDHETSWSKVHTLAVVLSAITATAALLLAMVAIFVR